MINSDEEKAIISEDWRIIIMVRYNFFRRSDSLFKWFWLAIIISGRSQQDKTNKGLDNESRENELLKLYPRSIGWYSMGRLIILISKL